MRPRRFSTCLISPLCRSGRMRRRQFSASSPRGACKRAAGAYTSVGDSQGLILQRRSDEERRIRSPRVSEGCRRRGRSRCSSLTAAARRGSGRARAGESGLTRTGQYLRLSQPRRSGLRRSAGRPHGAGGLAHAQGHRARPQHLHRPRPRRRLGQGRPPLHAGPVEAGRAEPGLPAPAHSRRALPRGHRRGQCVLRQDLRQELRQDQREPAPGIPARPAGRQGGVRKRAARARFLRDDLPERHGGHVRGPDLRRQPQQGGLEDDRFPWGDRSALPERREVSRQEILSRSGRHLGHELRENGVATRLKEADVVIVGLGWTGGILAKELSAAGLKVVALERGGQRSTEADFQVPQVRDELRYVVRHDLMMNTQKDTLTVRNNVSQEALPMRRLGSFLPGDVVGGSGVHWSGHTWRWTDMEFKVRSLYEERYGKKHVPEDMTIQDWGITYAELEPYYDKFEYTAAVSGNAGNIRGRMIPGGNPFEAPRARDYPLPPLTPVLAQEMFKTAAANNGYHPFPRPSANASRAYTNPDGSRFGACQYCGHCQRFGCEATPKAAATSTAIPTAIASPTSGLASPPWVPGLLRTRAASASPASPT